MKILFVLECANQPTNGTTASCIRFAQELEKKGHEVSIVGCDRIVGEKYHRYYGLPKYHFPVTDPLIVKGGFLVCRMIYKTLREAIRGQDVVHLFLPFKLSNVCRLIAEDEGVPCTTAFHIVPQNVTAAMHLAWSRIINGVLLYSFKRYLFNQVKYVHCPSPMAAEIMKKHRFKNNEPRVFTNGVIPFFHKIDVKKPKEFEDKFVICMTGRLVDEKRQDLILKAVAKSKYKDKMQVILCGQGTNYKYYTRLGRKLPNTPIIKFCTRDEVREILNYSDLYIHASDYEIEGIAAIEAISCGTPAVISDAKYCATKDFAVDKEHCLFKHGSPKSLRDKIDWLYEHPEALNELKVKYLESSKKYALADQVDKLEQMFIDAINDKKAGKDLATLKPRKKDKRLYKRYMRAAKKQELHPERYQ